MPPRVILHVFHRSPPYLALTLLHLPWLALSCPSFPTNATHPTPEDPEGRLNPASFELERVTGIEPV